MDLADAERRLQKVQNDQRSWKSTNNNRFALLGQDIPNVMQLIQENQRMFDKVPIGPIGNHIQLRDGDKWAAPVEFALKNLLGNFICSSSKDRKALERLCQSKGCRVPPIIVTE